MYNTVRHRRLWCSFIHKNQKKKAFFWALHSEQQNIFLYLNCGSQLKAKWRRISHKDTKEPTKKRWKEKRKK